MSQWPPCSICGRESIGPSKPRRPNLCHACWSPELDPEGWAGWLRICARHDLELHDEPQQVSVGACDETIEHAAGCKVCGVPVTQSSTGRPRVYCSRSCQARAYRARKAAGTANSIPSA